MADPKIVVRGEADFRRLNSDLGRTESRFGSFAKSVGKGLFLGTALATAGLVKLGIESTKSASAAEQSFGATHSVFGKYADDVIKRSRKAATAVGLSANEYRELANVTGAMLSSAGTPLRKVSGLTADLNKRAADMAATFGGPTSEAVQAISSLLRGETDPIERYGVSIKASDVSARLAAKGLDELTGKARKQAEQQERLALLFEQTASSQGAFRRESGTLANQTQKLDAQWENLKATLGRGLTPALTSLGKVANREILPPIQKLADKYVPKAGRAFGEWVENIDFSGAAADVGDFIEGIDWDGFIASLGDLNTLAREAGPALGEELGDGAQVAGTLLSFLADHTDELAKAMPYLVAGFVALKAAQVANNTVGRNSLIGFGLQIGSTVSLARANRSLAASLLEVNAASGASGAAGGLAGATRQMSKLQFAARGLGGAAGLGLLAHGAQQSNDKLGVLESTAGGALLGFSLAGPIGGAIGAGAGALIGLATQTDNAAHSFRTAVPDIDDMADSLNQLTGAITDQARVQALENARKRLEDFVKLDVGESNFGELTKEYGKFASVIEEIPDGSTIESLAARFGLSAREITQASLGQRRAIEAVSTAFRKHGRDSFDNVVAMRALRNIIGPVNKELRKNRAEVIRNAIATQDWSGKLKNFPKRAATHIDLKGVKPTETAIARLTLKYKDIDNKDIKTILGVTGVESTVKEIRRTAEELKRTDRKTATLQARIEGAAKVRTEVEQTRGVVENLDGDRADVWIYTHRITVYDTQGTPPGGRDPGRLLGSDNPLDVAPQIEELGRTVAAKAERAGRNIVAKLLRGITGGSAPIRTALDRLTAYIKKRIDLKDDKKERARERAVLKHLGDEYAALIRNGKAQDAINRKLEAAREHLAEVRGFVDQIRESFIETGNVVNLGQLEDGAVSPTLLLDQLRDRVAQAERFAALIRELSDDKGVKLNKTTLEQLLAAGPEAGLATAEALLSGGDAALAEVNSLTDKLAQSGQSLGAQMSDKFFDLGLNASIGLVEGLESQSQALDAAARRIAKRIADAVRKALGGGGKDTHRQIAGALGGIALQGIDATTARSRGRDFGVGMLDGFAVAAAPTLVTVKLTAEQSSQLQRGKALTLDINAGQARGVRRLNVTGR